MLTVSRFQITKILTLFLSLGSSSNIIPAATTSPKCLTGAASISVRMTAEAKISGDSGLGMKWGDWDWD